MIKAIYLLGDGDLAREVKSYIVAMRFAEQVILVGPRSSLSDEKIKGLRTEGPAIVVVGDSKTRKRIFEFHSGMEFCYFHHERVWIGPRFSAEEGLVMLPGVIVANDVTVDKNVLICSAVVIGHDAFIGAHSVIAPSVTISGNVEIRSEVFIGASATIIPGIKIGEGATIGAGAVVTKNVYPHETVVGNPARKTEGLPISAIASIAERNQE